MAKSTSIVEYIKSRGLRPAHVTQKMGVTKQTLYAYGTSRIPTARTLVKIANAMTELGAPTTAREVFAALDENVEGD